MNVRQLLDRCAVALTRLGSDDHAIALLHSSLKRLRQVEPELWEMLSPRERERALMLRGPDDAARYIAGRGILRIALSCILETVATAIPISSLCCGCDRWHGRPVVEASNAPAFSLSHSGDYILHAFTYGGAVGVDVEEVNSTRDVTEAVEIVLTARERSQVDSAEGRRLALLRAWVRKEAYLKGLGLGFRAEPQLIEVGALGAPTISTRVLDAARPSVAWFVADIDVGPDALGAIAAPFPVSACSVFPVDTTTGGTLNSR